MILRDKIIPVALVAALLGGSVGAFVAHRNTEPATAAYNTTTTPSADLYDKQNTRQISETANSQKADTFATQAGDVADAASYRTGFLDGFSAARDKGVSSRELVAERTVVPTSRVVYRNVPVRSRSYASNNTRRVYYDYNQPAKRSFWQKHRDKLTVAMGTGGGALLGAIIGGRKGAAIGALAGGGGSAIYTYGIRKRNRRY
jgi:hypothetical protein